MNRKAIAKKGLNETAETVCRDLSGTLNVVILDRFLISMHLHLVEP